MYFANPWGLLGLLALPAIAFIHLFQRRYPPHYVAGLFLWSNDLQVRAPGRRRDRLPVTRTLILELIAAAVISLVLADPRLGEWDQAQHLVVVLDDTASMQGIIEGPQTFRDAAVDEVEKRISDLPRKSVVTLIRSGSTPVTLVRRSSQDEARAALAKWQPRAAQHRVATAWEELGQQLVAESGKILFLTDHLPDPREIPEMLEVVSVGRTLNNVSFDAARWTFDSEKRTGEIFVRIRNDGRQSATCRVIARAAGAEVLNRELTIAADQATGLQLPVPGGLGALQLQLSSPNDGSTFDNQLQLVEPLNRQLKVAVTLPADEIEAREVQKMLAITPDVSIAPVAECHLLIGPSSQLPPSRTGLWWFGLGPIVNTRQAREDAKDLIGPYLVDKRHPLANGVTLGGVVWGGVQPVKFENTPVISADQNILLSQLRGTLTTAWLMNVELGRSNLTESPDWPVLFNNLIELRRDELPGLRRTNYRVGEIVRCRFFEGADPEPTASLVLKTPTSSRKLIREEILEIGDLQEPGIYTIEQNGQPWGRFAVNFIDPAESNLTRLHPGRHAARSSTVESAISLDNPYTWATWIGTIMILALLFADWMVLRPRALKSSH